MYRTCYVTTRLLHIELFSVFMIIHMHRAVYYVSPTESLSSCTCPGNSSCPPGELCHTMDYLAEHNSVTELFSPDHINVTLIFMSRVHNSTKDLTVLQNLHSFVMKGTAKSRETVVINYQHQSGKKYLESPIAQSFDFSTSAL